MTFNRITEASVHSDVSRVCILNYTLRIISCVQCALHLFRPIITYSFHAQFHLGYYNARNMSFTVAFFQNWKEKPLKREKVQLEKVVLLCSFSCAVLHFLRFSKDNTCRGRENERERKSGEGERIARRCRKHNSCAKEQPAGKSTRRSSFVCKDQFLACFTVWKIDAHIGVSQPSVRINFSHDVHAKIAHEGQFPTPSRSLSLPLSLSTRVLPARTGSLSPCHSGPPASSRRCHRWRGGRAGRRPRCCRAARSRTRRRRRCRRGSGWPAAPPQPWQAGTGRQASTGTVTSILTSSCSLSFASGRASRASFLRRRTHVCTHTRAKAKGKGPPGSRHDAPPCSLRGSCVASRTVSRLHNGGVSIPQARTPTREREAPFPPSRPPASQPHCETIGRVRSLTLPLALGTQRAPGLALLLAPSLSPVRCHSPCRGEERERERRDAATLLERYRITHATPSGGREQRLWEADGGSSEGEARLLCLFVCAYCAHTHTRIAWRDVSRTRAMEDTSCLAGGHPTTNPGPTNSNSLRESWVAFPRLDGGRCCRWEWSLPSWELINSMLHTANFLRDFASFLVIHRW